MLIWIKVVLLLSLFSYCLVLGTSVVSEYSVNKNMTVSSGVMVRYKAESRIMCALQCQQQSDCALSSFDRTTEEYSLHRRGDVTHLKDANQDILWKKGFCNENWWQFTGSCYFFSDDMQKWKEAQDDCKMKGANLVKINDAVENNWIYSIQQGQYNVDDSWIGANDINSDGLFVWSADNTTITYSNWSPGEPSNSYGGEDEDCVEFEIDGKWNDKNCNYTIMYICEI